EYPRGGRQEPPRPPSAQAPAGQCAGFPRRPDAAARRAAGRFLRRRLALVAHCAAALDAAPDRCTAPTTGGTQEGGETRWPPLPPPHATPTGTPRRPVTP